MYLFDFIEELCFDGDISLTSVTTQMSQKQRDLFSKGMVDLANIIAGALVFGQLVSGHVVDMGKMVLGIMLAGVFYVGAFSFSNERRP
jgi:hypothetical protein